MKKATKFKRLFSVRKLRPNCELIVLLITGWQRRWFVLSENGVLSYYTSHDEVDEGCKGSMNVAACEIIVSQNDNTRLDVVVSHGKVKL